MIRIQLDYSFFHFTAGLVARTLAYLGGNPLPVLAGSAESDTYLVLSHISLDGPSRSQNV